MRSVLAAGLIVMMGFALPSSDAAEPAALPKVAEGWKISLVAEAPQIVYPTAVVVAPDGTIYLGQDPMDMPGPPTVPADSVVAIKDGKVTVFADKLWSVMGLEWVDDTLYVVHAPFVSAFRDTNGDGKADTRIDLVTDLGPKPPGFNGINDHIASGIRMGMDGYLYIAIGDKGIPLAHGRVGSPIILKGGGVIRIRASGNGPDAEVVSTGECNPLSVALSATDEIFTYGNDDDSKQWPNSLTHHIVGGHYGYPYEFLHAPQRALPIMAGEFGGAGAQGICYNEDGLPPEYQGNLIFCDWGLQTVFRYQIEPKGATFKVKSRTPLVTKGKVEDFRPFSIAVSNDPSSLYLVDWAYNGWLASGVKSGRLYKLTYVGADAPKPTPRPGTNLASLLKALDHPAHSVRMAAQRALARRGNDVIETLEDRISQPEPQTGRLHALWALDAIRQPASMTTIREALADPDPEAENARPPGPLAIKAEAAAQAFPTLGNLLQDSDPGVRREAAIALWRMFDRIPQSVRLAQAVRLQNNVVVRRCRPPLPRRSQRRPAPCARRRLAAWHSSCEIGHLFPHRPPRKRRPLER